uniref:Ribosomal protein S19 n=1 Tax=Glaucocystis nostochinearum TaxID=38271 RepID=E9P6D9_9EUKA|nr:ribosomal protein S19 [Glaucocystis nostochinearum]ADW83123.1 ribosomal protein S19 [Glaucocystis nostochinearum]
MPRSIWKKPYFLNYLKNTKNKKKIWCRDSMILPEFINKSFSIHNGKNFLNVIVNEEMIGHKIGEFCSTRKKKIIKNKKNQLKKWEKR